jgi:hypothetical protein
MQVDKFIVAICTFGLCTSAYAVSQDCTRTLIPEQVGYVSDEVRKLSLAWSLSEGDYNEAKQNAGASANIYGVPVGANYGDFKQNVKTRAEQLHIDNFEKRAIAYSTTSLTEENRKIFAACVASNGGLDVEAGQIGADNYLISIYYQPPLGFSGPARGRVGGTRRNAPRNVQPGSLNELKREIQAINFSRGVWLEPPLTPANKLEEVVINIGVGPFSKSVILPPLSVPAAPPKKYQWKQVRTDDCGARDLTCTAGATPPDEHGEVRGRCEYARLGLAAVCWSGGANRDYPPGTGFEACKLPAPGQADWCTYKNVKENDCRRGGHPGTMYVCVYE